MKGNVWLAGYLVLTVALVGGAGFYFSQGLGAFGESFDGWDRLSSKIERLEKEVPHPSEENEKALEQLVNSYNGDVSSLYESLARYQKPLNTQISDSDFTTTILANKVNEFTKLAGQNQFEIAKKDEFYMAMGAYRATFPRPPLVPILNYQLDAIDHLLRQLVESGASRLAFVTREELPGESGDLGQEGADGVIPGQVVQKYPISLRFVSDHASFQKFVNGIANDTEYFFILRLLRVENSSSEGPDLSAGDAGPSYLDESGNPPPPEILEAVESTTTSFEEEVSAMGERGFQLQREDARIVFGQEKLEIFAVVDLVRFLPPSDEEAKVDAVPAE